MAEGFNPRHRRATIVDVARETGFALSTVSNALANKDCVTDATREKVRLVADRLGYRASKTAQSLRQRQSWSVGLVAGDISSSFFFPEILGRVEGVLWAKGYSVLLANTEFDPAKQTAYIRSMLDRGVDGLIFASQVLSKNDAIDIRTQGVPVACYNVEVPNIGADYVGVDNEMGGRIAMRHLSELGHRRIGFIGGREGSSSTKARLAAYKDELKAMGLTVDEALICNGTWSIDSGYASAKHIFAQPNPPTALVCANDSLAIGALGFLADAGLKAPSDVSVIGFDDIALSAHPLFKLTTIHYPKDEVATRTAELLVARIADREREPARVILEPHLVTRGSTGPAPSESKKRAGRARGGHKVASA